MLFTLLFILSVARAVENQCLDSNADEEGRQQMEQLLAQLDPYAAQTQGPCPNDPTPEELAAQKPDEKTPPPDEVKQVSVTVTSPSGAKTTVPMTYGIYRSPKNKGKARKTIIRMAGGPGHEWFDKGKGRNVPDDYDVIVFDYPGLGNNKSPKLNPATELTAAGAARLVEAIVGQEKPDDYVLYGHSWGTSVATIAASHLAKGDHPPKSVMLEGTLGRANKPNADGNGHEVTSGIRALTDKVVDELSPAEKTAFRAKLDQVLTIIKPENKKYIFSLLARGASMGAKDGSAYMRKIIAMPAAQVVGCIGRAMKAHPQGAGPARDDPEMEARMMHGQIAGCEDLDVPSSCGSTPYFRGMLTLPAETCSKEMACLCASVPKFDSAHYPIKGVPIQYLNGELDANTPLWQTAYHRQHQGQPQALTVFKGGGHGEFFGGDSLPPACTARIWSQAFAGKPEDFNHEPACQRYAPTRRKFDPSEAIM